VKFRTLLLGHHDPHCVERITTALDRMDPESRLVTVLSIEAKEQATLWELMKGRELGPEHFVPASVDPLKPVIHYGRNTLPAFKFFQKRFCRIEAGREEIGGFNAQPFSWFSGPGYFVAGRSGGEADAPAEFVIDYTKLPAKVPDGWPAIVPNDKGLNRLVYGGDMKDYMRSVSEHVAIGRPYKHGKPLNSYFVLCRQELG
jgi:hypothetical protein